MSKEIKSTKSGKCPTLKPMPPDSEFDSVQLAEGVKVELEHTADVQVAKQIAKAHLLESPDYYIELEKMERKLSTPKLTVEDVAAQRAAYEIYLMQNPAIADKVIARMLQGDYWGAQEKFYEPFLKTWYAEQRGEDFDFIEANKDFNLEYLGALAVERQEGIKRFKKLARLIDRKFTTEASHLIREGKLTEEQFREYVIKMSRAHRWGDALLVSKRGNKLHSDYEEEYK